MSSARSPLWELWDHYRRHQRVPTEWVARFSAAGNLDEAIEKAWATDSDPLVMARLACRFTDRRGLARAAADIARLLLPYVKTKKKRAMQEKALDFLQTWGEKPETREPKLGWNALADSVAPEDDKEDLATFAAVTISNALAIPEHPLSLRSLILGVHDRTAQSIVETEEGGRNRTELEIDEIDGRAQEMMNPMMVELLRKRIRAPNGDALVEALRDDREHEYDQALARNSQAQLAAFRPR